MTEEQTHLFDQLFTFAIGAGWQNGPFDFLDGWHVIEALWPMNELFRRHHDQIRSLTYDPAFESEADAALAMHIRGEPWTADSPSPGAWRVLLERHYQSIILALANESAGNARLVPVPKSLAAHFHKHAAMLFLQWAMPLPFPVDDAASRLWPEGPPPANLRRH